jgi:ferrochelatase
MFEKLKTKWEIKSNAQFWLIIFIFAIAGSSTLFVKRPAFELLGIQSSTPRWLVVPLYIIVVMPAYFVILLTYGTIFGQFRFFWEFEKRMFSSFGRKKKKQY